jgi:hypothetical protein
MIATLPVGSSVMMLSEDCCPSGLFLVFSDSNKGVTMSHQVSTPPLSGESILMDDDEIILLTDEMLPSEDNDIIDLCEKNDDEIILLTNEILPSEDIDIIELCEKDDLSDIQDETRKVIKFPDPANDKIVFIDLCDVLEETDLNTECLPDISVTEAETLNLNFDQIFDPLVLELKIPIEDTAPIDVLQKSDSEEIKYLAANKDSDTDNTLILLQDVVPLTLDKEFVESLSLTAEPAQANTLSTSDVSISPDTEYQVDDFQQLISEVAYDSHASRRNIPEIYSEFNKQTEKDAAMYKNVVAFQPMDQIEAAMERVIRNLFAERIEHILDEVVKTTVTREIENLKSILLDYLASGQSAGKIKS